jgi:hypothetical protein
MGRQGRTVLRGAVAPGVAVPVVALAPQPAQVDALDGATAGLTVVEHDGPCVVGNGDAGQRPACLPVVVR